VSVISASSDKVISTISVGTHPSAIAVSNAYPTIIYVLNTPPNRTNASPRQTVSVIDGSVDEVAAGVTFNIHPANSGSIWCKNKEYPTNTYLYVANGTNCIARPIKGFEFNTWIEGNPNSSTPLNSSGNLTINRYGAFTVSFMPHPVEMPLIVNQQSSEVPSVLQNPWVVWLATIVLPIAGAGYAALKYFDKIVKHFKKSAPLPELQGGPSIKFGRVIVKNRTPRMHGGTYDDGYYYVEVINEVPNTVAQGCKGSINMSTEQITHSVKWEDGSQTAKIGHKALLYLFFISKFKQESKGTRTFFYFPWENHQVSDMAEQAYENRLDKNLKVFIQSDNAKFPSEPLNITISQFINKATQE
jgi:hypothetical protein